MPLKLNVGLSKKIGQPEYGSLGASCHVELELEQSLLFHDLDGFHDKVRQAFVACSQAVKDELYRQQPENTGQPAGKGRRADHCSAARAGRGTVAGNGHSPPRDRTRPATSSQVRAIEAIVKRQKLNLEEILWNDYGINRADELTITEASRLIDDLKAPANGQANGHSNGRSNGHSGESS